MNTGQILLAPFVRQPTGSTLPRDAVTVTIGGAPARVLFAGPGTEGLLQVNVVVPDNIFSGDQLVELKVGDNSNSSQRVTVAVR